MKVLERPCPSAFDLCMESRLLPSLTVLRLKLKLSSLVAKAATWSQYKQSNTVKVLLAMSPQGVTTFASDCYGGRVSDKHLTRDCGILKKLLPGDVVLAN